MDVKQSENDNSFGYSFPPKEPGKTVIYLIRHGESEGNLKRICLGHTDLGLTEKGREQAVKTAGALSGVSIDAVYSSDLIRARQTAEPHAVMRGLSVTGIEALRELYFGDWENQYVDYLTETYGEMFTVGWRKNFGTFTVPKGESVVHCAARAEKALSDIAEAHPGGAVIVVSHAALIRALWGRLSGKSPEEYADFVPFPSNASFSVIVYDGRRLIPVSYSNDKHMGELATGLPMK